MLGKLAVNYFEQGYNCSQCILKAANDVYKLNLDDNCYNMLKGYYAGLSIGSICTVISACTMVFGLMFNVSKTKKLRMNFISQFQNKYNAINCSQLKNRNSNNVDCLDIILFSSNLLQKIIDNEI